MMIDVQSGIWYFYHYDALGSVVALSNTSGTIVEQYRYDAFGNTKVYDGSGTEKTDTSTFLGNPYMFTGRRLDTETRDSTRTGLYYYRARMYYPELGRFMQTDPIGYYDSMNLYQYCGNNPVNWIDPWGEFRFGYRSLGKSWRINKYWTRLSLPLRLGLNLTNADLYHEHGFFEDGSQENIGYFGPETDPVTGKKVPVGVKQGKNCAPDGEDPGDYNIGELYYDDTIMKQAIQNVNNSGDFDPEDYKLIGSGKNNCQDYATALRKEYKRLGGKVKYRPFGKRKHL